MLEHVASLFNLSDIYKSVEVWDHRHAQKILSVLSSVMKTGIGMIPIMISNRSLMMISWMNGMKSFKTMNCLI